jgi:LmbE family N-acetylglucosaminyl deacetylase
MLKRFLLFVLFISFVSIKIYGQTDTTVKVLIVTAHPDDETGCAAAVYAITHHLKGKVDLALITNGEGGYKYSTLAEDIYGLELTEEKTGREYLPTIRKRELLSAGKIIGMRDYFFFDQKDNRYTLDEKEVLDSIWNTELIKNRLSEIILQRNYDFIFCLLPVPETHGHHKAATILALKTVNSLPEEKRPVVLGISISGKNDTVVNKFTELAGYPITKLKTGALPFIFDRTKKFSYKGALSYKVIVNWEIAEHKSQGTMQLAMNEGDYEKFYPFDIDTQKGIEKAKKLFERLSGNFFRQKTY